MITTIGLFTAYVAVFHLKILIVEMVVMGSTYTLMGRLDILFLQWSSSSNTSVGTLDWKPPSAILVCRILNFLR